MWDSNSTTMDPKDGTRKMMRLQFHMRLDCETIFLKCILKRHKLRRFEATWIVKCRSIHRAEYFTVPLRRSSITELLTKQPHLLVAYTRSTRHPRPHHRLHRTPSWMQPSCSCASLCQVFRHQVGLTEQSQRASDCQREP